MLGDNGGSWRANGKEQGDNSMQQTLIKHQMGAEEQGARKPLSVSKSGLANRERGKKRGDGFVNDSHF